MNHGTAERRHTTEPNCFCEKHDQLTMQELRFINYSHPSEQSDPENRRRVASYIGVHFRNRSKPSNRTGFGPISGEYDDTAVSALDPSESQPYHPYLNWTWKRHSSYRPITQWSQNIASPHSDIFRDTHGIRSDPFYSYPVDFRPSVPRAVDFCKHSTCFMYGNLQVVSRDPCLRSDSHHSTRSSIS